MEFVAHRTNLILSLLGNELVHDITDSNFFTKLEENWPKIATARAHIYTRINAFLNR